MTQKQMISTAFQHVTTEKRKLEGKCKIILKETRISLLLKPERVIEYFD